MSARSYWVGLPVGITVHDDGSVTIEVDASEASEAMAELWREQGPDNGFDWPEDEMLIDCAVVDAERAGPAYPTLRIPAKVISMRCPVRYACGFTTASRDEMVAHIGGHS